MKKIVMIIMVAAFALPAMAQQHEWQSTSTLQGTGSSYSSQVTAVGAVTANEMATTTESYSPGRPGNPRRGKENPGEVGYTGEEGSPIGDAVLPLMLMAIAFCGYTAIRRKRQAEKA